MWLFFLLHWNIVLATSPVAHAYMPLQLPTIYEIIVYKQIFIYLVFLYGEQCTYKFCFFFSFTLHAKWLSEFIFHFRYFYVARSNQYLLIVKWYNFHQKKITEFVHICALFNMLHSKSLVADRFNELVIESGNKIKVRNKHTENVMEICVWIEFDAIIQSEFVGEPKKKEFERCMTPPIELNVNERIHIHLAYSLKGK